MDFSVLFFPAILILCFLFMVCSLFLWIKNRNLRRQFSSAIQADAYAKNVNAEANKFLASAQEKEKALEQKIKEKKDKWEKQYSQMTTEIESLSKNIDSIKDISEMQSFGIYEPLFSFDDSKIFKEEVDETKDHQKELIRCGLAATCETDWMIEGSEAKGRQMTNRYLKLMLRAFNGESNNAIAKVKFNNVVALENRLHNIFNSINDLGKYNHCQISEDYLHLKIRELQVSYEYEVQKKKEKDEQVQIRQQMREEEKVRKELEKMEAVAAKEEKSFEQALVKAKLELETRAVANEESKRKSLLNKIKILEQQLKSVHKNKVSAIARGRLTKSGHVYVISNIGSFGSDVYKIGMTRRLEPLDRIRELGDASVPFKFDVHAMIYCQDAPELEKKIHEKLSARQVNLVNQRREFFNISLDEIEELLLSLDIKVDFVRTAIAEEYRQSAAIREKNADVEAQKMRDEQTASIIIAKNQFEGLKSGWRAESLH